MLKSKEDLLIKTTKKFLELVKSHGRYMEGDENRLMSIVSHVQIQRNEIVVTYPETFVILLKFLAKTAVYYPRLIERLIELAKCFPKLKLECASESLASKTTEYLCINFYISVFHLISSERTILPEDQRLRLQNEIERNLQINVKATFECMQTTGRIPPYRKGLIFGIMKGLGQGPLKLSESMQEFMISVIDSVGEDSLKKPKNRVALIFGVVASFIGSWTMGSKRWNEDKIARYRAIAQAHIAHQLKQYKCPNMLFSCFKLLCNDFLMQMTREKKFLLSYAKAKPDSEYLASTVRDIVYHYPLVRLRHIKCILAVYVDTLQRLYEIIPLSISQIDSFWLLNQFARQWVRSGKDEPSEKRFKEVIEVTQIFESAVALLMRNECLNAKEGVENTAAYKLLIQILVDLNKFPAASSEEMPEYAFKGLQYILNLLRKANCEQLTTKVLIQIIPSVSYFNQITDPSKLGALVGDFVKLSQTSSNPFAFQQSIRFLCNLYRSKVLALCSNPTIPPVLTQQLSLALQAVAKAATHRSQTDSLFIEVSDLFVSVALQIAPHVNQPNSAGLPLNLFFLIKPLYVLSKKTGHRYLDLECNPSTETANRYFNIWLYIVLYREFSGCTQQNLSSEKISMELQKLALHTPPVVFHCGRNIRGYLKYEPCVYQLSATALTELTKLFSQTHTAKIPNPISSEEYIYAFVVFTICSLQIKCLQSAQRERVQKCVDLVPPPKVTKKYVILPTFFVYLFDSGIQYMGPLLELFNVMNGNLFVEYFNALNLMQPCALRELLIVEDTVFLLKSSCNLFSNIRIQSMKYLRNYCDWFPFILTRPKVLFTFLDIIGTVYNELYLSYDSLSHILRLPHSSQTIILPVEKAQKQESFRFLIKLFEELYLKAALINEAELVAVFQEYVHRTVSTKAMDSLAHFGVSFFQNLYANYKNYDAGVTEDHSFNYLANLEGFNKHVQGLIAKQSLTNTVNQLIEKSSRIHENMLSLDSSKLANTFKSLLTKTAQYSQLKTKYYGIVKGLFKNFKGILSQSLAQITAKSGKEEYTAELARKIGLHLIRKLKKNLRKHLYIQLDSLHQNANTEEDPAEDTPQVESFLSGDRDRKQSKAYFQLRSLTREEKPTLSTKPQKFFDLLGQLTALLIICKEKKLPSLKAFEEELLSVICYAPSYCLTKEIMAAGAFCWNWISTIPGFSRESLYLNLTYSLLLSLNAGGIFDSPSIQSSLVPDPSCISLVLESPEFKGFPEIYRQQVEGFTGRLLRKIRTGRLSILMYEEHSYNFSRDSILEGLNIWLKFIMHQLKNIIGSNTRDILGIYKIIKHMINQPVTSKSKRCLLDLQVRFRIFNLALYILSMMRFYKDIFKNYTDAIEFQYKAYLFIWQYFGNKNKYCSRNSGEFLQNDTELLKETIELLNADTNMAVYCERGAAWVDNLNDYTRDLHKHKGTCRFTHPTKKVPNNELYRLIQSPIELPGGTSARIEVQGSFMPLDSTYYTKVYGCLKALMIILVCELINELKAWNTGSIKQKRAGIQKTHYGILQSEGGIKIILTEALKVSPKLAIRFIERLRSFKEIYADYLAQLTNNIFLRPAPFYRKSRAFGLFVEKYIEERKTSTKWDQALLRTGMYWKRPKAALLINYLSNVYEKYYPLHELVIASLDLSNIDVIDFNLAQLFQCLRTDTKQRVFRFFMRAAKKSRLLCHKILWMAKVEAIVDAASQRKVALPYPVDELPILVQQLFRIITKSMPKGELTIYNNETDFFEKITEISGSLKVKEQSKPEKKAIIQKYLEKYQKELESRELHKPPIYLMTNPNFKVVRIVTNTGVPMQSAARNPIMVSFVVEQYEGPDKVNYMEEPLRKDEKSRLISMLFSSKLEEVKGQEEELNEIKLELIDRKASTPFEGGDNGKDTSSNDTVKAASVLVKADPIRKMMNTPLIGKRVLMTSKEDCNPFTSPQGKAARLPTMLHNAPVLGRQSFSARKPQAKRVEGEKTVACIFKAKDDVRQDTLSLQVIKIFQEIFKKTGLDLFLYPYSAISNRTGEANDLGGIIECIPNTASRDQLGKAFDSDLYQYFIDKFGQETTAEFQIARKNFIKSLAAYSLISYILQIKDRHNGNILIDNEGHIAHIDFGFIFDWSPGRDMRFESANFKLTSEMIKILGGDAKSEAYNLFVNLTIRAFLAIREYYDVIIATVYPMFHSGQPCFKPWSMKLLLDRFKLEMNSSDAAKYIKEMIWDAHNKITTRLYDVIQKIQNNIYH